jgi:hypothetical protein
MLVDLVPIWNTFENRNVKLEIGERKNICHVNTGEMGRTDDGFQIWKAWKMTIVVT